MLECKIGEAPASRDHLHLGAINEVGFERLRALVETNVDVSSPSMEQFNTFLTCVLQHIEFGFSSGCFSFSDGKVAFWRRNGG